MDEMTTWLEGVVEEVDSEVVVRFLAKKGWNEKNFQVHMIYSRPLLLFISICQVSAKLYGLLVMLAEGCPSFGRASAALSIPHLSEKLGDMKLKKPAGDALLAFSEKTSLQFVLNQGSFQPKGVYCEVTFLQLTIPCRSKRPQKCSQMP